FVGGGGGTGAAIGREEGRWMRMQSIVFPPVVVLVGYNSICSPGQSSVSGKPVASQTASKFVAFNGSDFGRFSKENFWVFLRSRPLSGSYRALSIVTMRGFPFRSAAFRYLLGKTSSRVMSRSFHRSCCLWEIAKVRGSGPDLSKLDCPPVRAAVSASHDGPKNVVVRWRPGLAIRAIAGDSVQDFDHRALPVPSSAAMRSNAVPRGPDARPCESRDKARRITSGSAPDCTAIENKIAVSRALVSAALLLLWLLRNSSAIEPLGNRPTVHV